MKKALFFNANKIDKQRSKIATKEYEWTEHERTATHLTDVLSDDITVCGNCYGDYFGAEELSETGKVTCKKCLIKIESIKKATS